MEVMTPVFLCALVALLPQALGKTSKNFLSISDIVKNKLKDETRLYVTNNFSNFGVSNANKVSDLQSVFMNPACKECHTCMELSIKSHKVHSHINRDIKTNDVPNEIDNLDGNTTHRNKRNLEVDQEVKVVKKSTKKSKTKKSKNNKSVSVTKYSKEGRVYALKVKETITPIIQDLQNRTKAPISKCQVYRIRESFSCDSPGANLILAEKRKVRVNKARVKEESNNEMNIPTKDKETERIIVPQFKKRHVVEEPQASENFMPSIEEMY